MLIPNNMTGLNRVQNSQQGFTLIELLMTIAIMAVVLALVAPGMGQQLANQRVKDTAKTIEMALKDAKAQSVILGKNVTVTYAEASDDSQATIALSVVAAAGSVKQLSLHQLDDSAEVKMELLSSDGGDSDDDNTDDNDNTDYNDNAVVFQPSKTVNNGVKYTVCDSSSSSEIPIEVVVDAVANVSAKIVTEEGRCS